jgi:hypothetical protein
MYYTYYYLLLFIVYLLCIMYCHTLFLTLRSLKDLPLTLLQFMFKQAGSLRWRRPHASLLFRCGPLTAGIRAALDTCTPYMSLEVDDMLGTHETQGRFAQPPVHVQDPDSSGVYLPFPIRSLVSSVGVVCVV